MVVGFFCIANRIGVGQVWCITRSIVFFIGHLIVMIQSNLSLIVQKLRRFFFPGEDNCNAQYGINNVLIPVYLTKCGLKF